MKSRSLFSPVLKLGLAAVLCFAGYACDTTPRERKAVAERELDKLGNAAEAAAAKSREEAKAMGKAYRQRRQEDKARHARQPVVAKQQQMEQDLLGEYRNLSQVTAGNLRDAYVHFLQQVRARQGVWTMEDWDYADAIYKRLNDREKALHDDIILRHATKIKALQAEYVALENKADVQDFQRVKKEQSSH